MLNQEFKIMFIRDSKRQPVACLATKFSRDSGNVYVGMSVLNPCDRFNREMARSLAVGRAITQPVVVKADSSANAHDISRLIMNSIVSSGFVGIPARVIRAAKLWLKDTVSS